MSFKLVNQENGRIMILKLFKEFFLTIWFTGLVHLKVFSFITIYRPNLMFVNVHKSFEYIIHSHTMFVCLLGRQDLFEA